MHRRTLCAALIALSTAVAGVHADTHRFVPTTFYATYSVAHPPALRLRSGDRVITTTAAEGGQTGPFFVEDAAPGDMLVVSIEKLMPNQPTGTSAVALVPSALEDPTEISSNKDTSRLTWAIDTARGVVRLVMSDVARHVKWAERFVASSIELPLQPMLGSIGLAPAGENAANGPSGPFGGALAYAGVAPGAKVMLPVSHAGALLFLGQGYARQGDGQLTKAGIVTSMDVEFSVELVKKQEWPHSSVPRPSTIAGEFKLGWPRIETADTIATVSTGRSLLQALQRATLEMHHWLDDDFGFSEKLASIFVGQAIEYDVAHAGDPNFVVAARVRKSFLPRPAAAE